MAKITQCKGERLFEMPRKDSLARRCLTTTATTHLLYSEVGASQGTGVTAVRYTDVKSSCVLEQGGRRSCFCVWISQRSNAKNPWVTGIVTLRGNEMVLQQDKDNVSTTSWADSGLKLMSFYWGPLERDILSWFVICGQIPGWIIKGTAPGEKLFISKILTWIVWGERHTMKGYQVSKHFDHHSVHAL